MLSDILLLLALPLLRIRKVLSVFLLSGTLAVLLKLLFRVPRETGLDPFTFPSLHTALAAAPFSSHPNLFTLLLALGVGLLRVLEGYHSLPDVVGGFAVALLAKTLYDLLPEDERDRKALHMGISIISGYFMLFLPQLPLATLLLATALLSPYLPFLSDIHRALSRGKGDRGPATLAFGLYLGALLQTGPLVGFTLGLVDGMAALAGRLAGKKGKSLVGLAGGYVGALGLFLLHGFYPLPLLLSVALLSPLLEYLTPVDDNLVLSLFVALTRVVVA